MKHLVGVGVGPGDPDLITVKAIRVLRAADLVLVPVLSVAEPGRAELTVRAHLDHDRLRRVEFALNDAGVTARRRAAWDAAAESVLTAYREGAETVAFATIGDPAVFSTFSYLAQTVRDQAPEVQIGTVPGITAMQDLAARTGTVLCEGTETLGLVPVTAGVEVLQTALTVHDTVIAYKVGHHFPEVRAALERAGRLDHAMYGAHVGLSGEDIRPVREVAEPAGYLSTVVVTGHRGHRGGRL